MSLSIEEAQARILEALKALPAEVVDLEQALGRVAAEPVRARRALPLFDNSAMDGYALCAGDTERAPVTLRLVETVPAGHPSPRRIGPGEAARIFTGAPLPPGANAVVMQEDVQATRDAVTVPSPLAAGKNVRRAGEDMGPGTGLFDAGALLGPGELAALGTQGILRLAVTRKPIVAIVPTGDELVELHETPGPGQVPNGNALMLAAQVRTAGGVPRVSPPAPDEPSQLAERLAMAARGADLVLTCGGVSVGDFDFVRQVLGSQVAFFSVAMKPGKPLAFGHLGAAPLIGLPGNPVSAFVCFELFARPALQRLAGAAPDLPREHVRLAQPHTPDRKRRELVRARRLPGAQAEPLARQGSHHLSSLLGVDLLLDVPAGTQMLATGTELIAWAIPRAFATGTTT